MPSPLPGKPATIKPAGLTDSQDGSNSFPGSMQLLRDLVPSPYTANQFVPRPASVQLSNFSPFTTPGAGTAILVIGNLAYGFIGSGRFAGHDEPFMLNLQTGAFTTLANVTSANTPLTPSATGDWTPPTLAMISNRIVMTHPGYDGVTHFVGWIDMTGFASVGLVTGNTHNSTLLDNLSTNVLAAGWQVGQVVTDAAGDIPAGTYIVAIAAGGLSLTLSQAATGANVGTALTVKGGTTAAPIYGAGQVNTNGLAALPVAVAQFNNRAYYAVNNSLQFSDPGEPLQQTNASQQVVLGDNSPVTALAGLPLGSQIIGGIVQSLIAFKSDGVLYQVTGDVATLPNSNFIVSAIDGSVGTLAPNTICATPKGLAFVAPDGLRFLNQAAILSDPVGVEGQGVSVPFISAINPSRMTAAYNQNVVRISVQNGAVNGQPVQEYWYHMNKGIWTGPHSFPASMIEAWNADDNTFVLFGSGISGKLWRGDPLPGIASTFTENGVAMSTTFQTTLFPDNEEVAGNCIIESAMMLGLPQGWSVNFAILNESGNVLANASVMTGGAGASLWGAFNWGTGVWGSGIVPVQQYQIPWPNESVFKQGSLLVSTQSAYGVVLGNFYPRIEVLSYIGVGQ